MNMNQSMMENSPLAMATTEGPAHKVRFVNEAFCALQGKQAAEIIGHSISEAISGGESDSVAGLLDLVYDGQKSGFVNILQYAHPGHNLKYESYMAWDLPVMDGHAKSLVIQVTDFTDQIRVNERIERTTREILALNSEMREINEQLLISAVQQHALADMTAAAELRLRNIVYGLNAIVCEVDALTGKFTFVSKQAEAFLGYPLERWTGEGFWKQIIYKEDYAMAMAGFQMDAVPGDAYQHAFRVAAADGTEIWLRNIMKAVKGSDGAVVKRRCIIVDVTEEQSVHLALVKDLDRNRSIAEALQYSILWQEPEKSFSRLKVVAFYEPALDEALVGGDFFDAFSLPNKSVLLIVGDVTGKGLKAAARTTEILFALRAFAQDYSNPADLLARLNEFTCNFHYEDDGMGNALVVLSLVVVNPATGAAQVASAGAEPPLILRASGAVEEVPIRGFILGVNPGATYEMKDLFLEEGDTLFMSTDGITEARNGPNFFGSEGLLEAAQKADEAGTLHDVGKAIMDAARAYGGGDFKDDVCLLLTRRDFHVTASVPSNRRRGRAGSTRHKANQ